MWTKHLYKHVLWSPHSSYDILVGQYVTLYYRKRLFECHFQFTQTRMTSDQAPDRALNHIRTWVTSMRTWATSIPTWRGGFWTFGLGEIAKWITSNWNKTDALPKIWRGRLVDMSSIINSPHIRRDLSRNTFYNYSCTASDRNTLTSVLYGGRSLR